MGNEVFARRIKELREKRNLTMEALAKQLNITKSRVNMWENNGTVPRQDVLIKISELFEVSADYLLGNDANEGKNPNKNKLNRIQRGLNKMNDEQLDKAEEMLKLMFKDLYEGK